MTSTQAADTERVAVAGEALAAARGDLAEAMEAAKSAAVGYVRAGGSEAEAARLAQLDRMTVRKALGK